ncbi:hypothetical protein ACEPAH_4053 [Sanghuangporus vaninii]
MNKQEIFDYRPLISRSDDGIGEAENIRSRWNLPPAHSPWHNRVLVVVFVVQSLLNIFLIVSGLYLYSRRGPSNPIFPQLTYSPVQDLVSFGVQKFYEGFGENITIYQGNPSDEVDQAWEDLYSFGISEVPRSIAEKLPNKTYPLAGSGGNYILELDVFHQLHCLNTLRMALSPDYYRRKNLSKLELSFLEPPHARHCLDAIRQSLMCNADIATYVWQWDAEDNMVKPTGNVVHTCRDFERIVDWAKGHRIRTHFDNKVYVEDNLDVPIIYA